MRARIARGEEVELISNLDAQRSAVRSIAWLGLLRFRNGLSLHEMN